jgi:hypothetical protein
VSEGLVGPRSDPSRLGAAVGFGGFNSTWTLLGDHVQHGAIFVYYKRLWQSNSIPFFPQRPSFLIRKALTPGLPNRPTKQARAPLGLFVRPVQSTASKPCGADRFVREWHLDGIHDQWLALQVSSIHGTISINHPRMDHRHCGCYMLRASVSRHHWRHFLEGYWEPCPEWPSIDALPVTKDLHFGSVVWKCWTKAYAEMAEVCKYLRKESTR